MSDLAERLVRVLEDHQPTGGYVGVPTAACSCGAMIRIPEWRTHLADALAAEVGRALEDKACAFCRGCHPADLDRCICGLWPVLLALAPTATPQDAQEPPESVGSGGVDVEGGGCCCGPRRRPWHAPHMLNIPNNLMRDAPWKISGDEWLARHQAESDDTEGDK